MALKGLDNVRKALDEVDKPFNDGLRTIYLQGLGNIAIGTPRDEGRTSSNWFLKVDSPSSETTSQKGGNQHLEKMPMNVLGKRIYYANNLPNIVPLEYGLYLGVGPKTVVAAGGIYSDQAPGGWVRDELLRMRAGIRKLNK